MNKIGTKRINTERCVLRRIIPNDYQMMYENWARYEEVCRYFPFNPITDIEIYKEKVHKCENAIYLRIQLNSNFSICNTFTYCIFC